MVRLVFSFTFLFILHLAVKAQHEASHEQPVRSLAFSVDGKVLISGGDDQVVRLWNTATGHMINSLKHPFEVKSLIVSKNGRYMLAGNGKQNYFLWNIENGDFLKEISGYEVHGFTPDSRHVILSNAKKKDQKYSVYFGLMDIKDSYFGIQNMFTDNREITTEKLVKKARISSDSKILILSDGSRAIRAMYLNSQKNRSFYFEEEVKSFALHSNDTLLIAGNSDEVFNIHTGELVVRLEEKLQAEEFIFSSDGSILFSLESDNIKRFNLGNGKLQVTHTLKNAMLLQVSPDRSFYAVADHNNSVYLFDPLENSVTQRFVASELVEEGAFRHYVRGAHYLNEGNYQEAIRYFSSCLGKTEKADKVFLLRGHAYMEMGESEMALLDYLKDQEMVPYRSSFYLAKAFADLNHTEKAIAALDSNQKSLYKKTYREIQNDPHLKRLLHSKEWQKKTFHLSEAEKLIQKGEYKVERGEKLAGLELISRAIRLEPERAEWYYKRAKVHMRLNETHKARMDYKKMFDADSTRKAEYYIGTARSYCKDRENRKCIYNIKKAIEADVSLYNNILDIVEIELSSFQRKEALRLVNKYIEIIPDDPHAYYLRSGMQSETLHIKDDLEKAIQLYKEQGKQIPKEVMDVYNTVK
ncbi:MAG: WD40 repeat domain-containing protein [Cytophagaceae bacterium]